MNRIFSAGSILAISAVSLVFTGCSDDDDRKIIGLNEAARYGKITVTLSGDRADGEAFSSKKEYKFMPEEGPAYSEVTEAGEGFLFNVQRMHGAANNDHNDNYAQISDFVGNDDSQSGTFYINTSIINRDDETYFYVEEEVFVTPDDVTQYSYDESNGKLKITFEVTIENSSSTGNDITLEVVVNVSVFEEVVGQL